MVLTQTSLPGKRTVAQLSNDTGMSRPQIKNWFYNQRRRMRRNQSKQEETMTVISNNQSLDASDRTTATFFEEHQCPLSPPPLSNSEPQFRFLFPPPGNHPVVEHKFCLPPISVMFPYIFNEDYDYTLPPHNLRGIRETTSLFGKPSELSQIIRRQYGPPKPKDLSSNQAHISPGESANGADSNSPDPRIPRVLEDNQSPEQSQLGEPIVGYNELRRDMTRPLSTNSPAQWKGKARATYNVIDTSTIPRPINPVDLPIVGPIGLNPKLGGSNPQTVLREKLTPEDSASQTGQAPLSHVSQAGQASSLTR
ncbi:hypothetical protein F5877DRAFT_83633 [Lentinula edodes]|nr:hypothetical protein F5877DRAFT_83633 [Lentinula edodes]